MRGYELDTVYFVSVVLSSETLRYLYFNTINYSVVPALPYFVRF